jgi:hypothetical protein
MNDKDKEAFEKWFDKVEIKWDLEEAWQAACEYKQKEIDKLQAENAKLEKCIRLFAFPEGRLEHADVERVTRQVLKELHEE